MKLSPHTLATRHTVLMVLLAWMFALVSGVANACLLEAHEIDSAVGGYAATTHASGAQDGHGASVAGSDDDFSTSAAPCLKVCDENSHAVVKQASSVAQTDVGLASQIANPWGAVTPGLSAPHRMSDKRNAAPELPTRLRYSRLAL